MDGLKARDSLAQPTGLGLDAWTNPADQRPVILCCSSADWILIGTSLTG